MQRGGRRIERRGKRESANALFIDAATSPVGAATERTPVQPFFRKKGGKKRRRKSFDGSVTGFSHIALLGGAFTALHKKKVENSRRP